MGKKRLLTDDEVRKIHSELVANSLSVKEAAERNSVNTTIKPMTLYMSFRRLGLSVKNKQQ